MKLDSLFIIEQDNVNTVCRVERDTVWKFADDMCKYQNMKVLEIGNSQQAIAAGVNEALKNSAHFWIAYWLKGPKETRNKTCYMVTNGYYSVTNKVEVVEKDCVNEDAEVLCEF